MDHISMRYAMGCMSIHPPLINQLGGIFRRVRFALACRTKPLLRFYAKTHFLSAFFFYRWSASGLLPRRNCRHVPFSPRSPDCYLQSTGGKLGVPLRIRIRKFG